MRIRNFLALNTQVRYCRNALARVPARFATPVLLACLAMAISLSPIGISQENALPAMKAAADSIAAKRYQEAIARLKPLAGRSGTVSDYAAFLLATAHFESGNYSSVPGALTPVWNQTPPSPLIARSALLASRAYKESGDAQRALETLRGHYASLPQPQADAVLAAAFVTAGDDVNAATYYQRVYYNYPLSSEAAEALLETSRLRTKLGDAYPPAAPDVMLGRAVKLLDAGQAAKARRELLDLLPKLRGSARDVARVRIGAADYAANQTQAAYSYLKSLEVDSQEADAERLYHLVVAARKLKNQDEVSQVLDRMARLYPNSRWRMEALIWAANHYVLLNQIEGFEPLFRACYESFPADKQAAYCHWKVAWGHYIRRQPDAASLFRAHLRNYPSSEQAVQAIYFLGRLSERSGDRAGARAFYDEILRAYPNYFYATLVRERLKEVRIAPSAAALEFLRSIAFPERARTKEFLANARALQRLERARMLASGGLEEWAEVELRYGAQFEDQPHVLAIELATISSRRVGPDQALRWIKRFAPSYLYWTLDSAPARFWQLAFPLPWRDDLERYSKQNRLDPFLVAALIRQESEFNPKAVSRADARGLTQIRPSTGRELSRRLKVRPYSTVSLFKPEINLRLGTHHLRSMINELDGSIEAALAAYNAGLSRAVAWLSWAEFREPAEFIETIPFSETRGYVQIVLRNADIYRRLYGEPLRASKE